MRAARSRPSRPKCAGYSKNSREAVAMPDRIPDEELDLDAIEARAEKATPGPWKDIVDSEKNGWRWHEPRLCGFDRRENHAAPPWFSTGPRVESPQQAELDSSFIAHARTDVPALTKEVRRLRD